MLISLRWYLVGCYSQLETPTQLHPSPQLLKPVCSRGMVCFAPDLGFLSCVMWSWDYCCMPLGQYWEEKKKTTPKLPPICSSFLFTWKIGLLYDKLSRFCTWHVLSFSIFFLSNDANCVPVVMNSLLCIQWETLKNWALKGCLSTLDLVMSDKNREGTKVS